MLIDANNKIVGRLGTVVAKKALLGEKIDIVNAENAVISGRKDVIFAKFKQKVSRGTPAKPRVGSNTGVKTKRCIPVV